MAREEPEPFISRDELTGIFFSITDIAHDVRAIRELLENDEEEAE